MGCASMALSTIWTHGILRVDGLHPLGKLRHYPRVESLRHDGVYPSAPIAPRRDQGLGPYL